MQCSGKATEVSRLLKLEAARRIGVARADDKRWPADEQALAGLYQTAHLRRSFS